MKYALFASALGLAVMASPAVAQFTAEEEEAMMEARFDAPPAGWEVPRTDWGDPDLRGKWPIDYLAGTPRTRSPQFGDRRFLTDEEYAAAFDTAEDMRARYDEEEDANMMAMGHWNERGHPLRQTSLTMEPANGQMPPQTEEGRRRSAAEKTSWNTYVFETMDDFGVFDRCLTRGMPGSMLPGAYNMGIEIFQSPGLVAITVEMIHETRMVYLDGRDPPPANMHYDLGYSIGHWEGDTLVIETTNFRPLMSGGNSDQMRIVEHLTMKNPGQIHYEAWVEDPVVLTGPYKLDFPWVRNDDYGMYEYACHEGNVQVRGYIMSTSPRFAEQRAAVWRSRGEEPESGVPVR